jgi:triphosphatase
VAAEANLLSRGLNVERGAGLAKAQAALETERYRMLGLNTVLWLVDGGWSRTRTSKVAACRDRPIQAFADDVLRQRAKKLIKKAQRIEELNARQRHKLRIASKKLRYAAEFFATLVSDKRRSRHRRFLQILKTFQGALGKLNDMEAHKNIARRIARPATTSRTQSRKSLAMGYIAGQEQSEVTSCLAVIDKLAKKPLPKFWR